MNGFGRLRMGTSCHEFVTLETGAETGIEDVLLDLDGPSFDSDSRRGD